MMPMMMIEYSCAERMAVRDDARLSFGGCSDGGRDGPFFNAECRMNGDPLRPLRGHLPDKGGVYGAGLRLRRSCQRSIRPRRERETRPTQKADQQSALNP